MNPLNKLGEKISLQIQTDEIAFFEAILGLPIHLHKGQVRWSQHSHKTINILRPGNKYGKGGRVDEPILTPKGWKTFGDIKVGDKLFDKDGKETKVLDVFPQGKQDTFKFVFKDNASLIVDSSHLWMCQTPTNRFRKNYPDKGKIYLNRMYKQWSVLSTNEIIKRWGLKPRNKNKITIPVIKPIEFEEKSVSIDPYQLGLLLGDGSFVASSLTFTTADKELLKGFNWKYIGNYGYRILKTITLIRDLGLKDLHSWEKHIPEIYLFNSIENRIAILQGLMDTDGTIEKYCGVTEFSSTSQQLAKDVLFIVQSLGGQGTISSRVTSFTYKGIKKKGRVSYRVRFKIPNIIPFKLKRKVKRYYKKTTTENRILKEIIPMGKAETVCFVVDSPSRTFVAKDFIVTHNSMFGGGRHLWHACLKPLLPKGLSDEQWLMAKYDTLNFGPGYEQAREILRMARDICEGRILIPEKFQHEINPYTGEEYGSMNKSMLAGWFLTEDRSEAVALPSLEFWTNASLLGRSYDQMGQAFKMKALAYASGDECADIKELWTFTNGTLLPRMVTVEHPQIDYYGTPQPEGTDYMVMIEMAEEDMKKPDWKENGMWYVQKGSMYENVFLPEATIRQIESIADPTLREQIIRGEYVEVGDKYFGFTRVQNMVDNEIKLLDEGYTGRKYITAVDFAGGESVWADYTVIMTIDYTEEPYKVVQFRRFKGGDMPIPMQYALAEEICLAFGGKGTLIIDSSALGGKNAMAFLRHLNPISAEFGPTKSSTLKMDMLASLKIALDGGQSETRKRVRKKDDNGDYQDTVEDWGLLRCPFIPVLINELQNYKLDDTHIRQDCVMTLMMLVHWIEMRRPKSQKKQAVDWDSLSIIQ